MLALCLLLIAATFAVALPATWLARRLGRRLNALDGTGVPGQVKFAPRRVPNTGGIGIFAAIFWVIGAGLVLVQSGGAGWIAENYVPQLQNYLPGLAEQTPGALCLLGALLVLHIVGVVDDRRALGPYTKLIIMAGLAAAMVLLTDSRLLTLLDHHAGGAWLSVVVTVLWIVVVTNAFNFLDNMDGLSAGVAAISASSFLVAALALRQWFIAATLAVMVGSLLGFLVFNFPWRTRRVDAKNGPVGGASVFMGDGGSLVIGFLLAFLTVRITYYTPEEIVRLIAVTREGAMRHDPTLMPFGGSWYSMFMPVVILAVPLYDFTSVVMIRLSQGKSPFVGDLQHFSHRLVSHGLSQRIAVLVIYGCTAVTSIGGILLAHLDGWPGALVFAQTILVLLVIALYEWARPAETVEPRS